ncbi:hypothetical protein AB0E85_30575 [Streptomyces sp. NPDC029044]|uniref:hypothetical protein n=1 Tax=Streptomyces sp. NPDC029044 TaxID=3157198 RepID=UPI0033CC8B60
MHEPRPEQEKALARLAEVIAPLWHEGLDDRLSAMARLRLYLVRNTMLDELLELVAFEGELAERGVATPVVADGGRAYARYPYLRDPSRGIPDICYDVTKQLGVRHHVTHAALCGSVLHLAGHGYLHRVATEAVSTELVLRERGSGTEYRLPVTHTATPGLGRDEDEGRYPYDRAGFEAAVDITTCDDGAPLPDGLWDISLTIGAQGICRDVRIGSKRDGGVSGAPTTHIVAGDDEIRAVTLYATRPHGNFTLDIGERKHAVPPQLTVTSVRWAPGTPAELEFTGRCTLAALPDGVLAVHLEDGAGGSAVFPARACSQVGDDLVVRVPVTELPAGLWTGQLRLGGWAWSLPPAPAGLPPAKWRRHGLPWYAKPVTGQGEEFGLHVARTHLARAVARRLKS